MNRSFVVAILIVLSVLMSGYEQCCFSQSRELSVRNDTIIGSRTITDEIAGSAYRKRAKGYFVILNKDTSDFTCIFVESKEDGKVGVLLNIPYAQKTMSYLQRMTELKAILKEGSKDFNFDSLNSISFGRLILSGDLAVQVTRQYRQTIGLGDDVHNKDYKKVIKFMQQSKLATDLNEIFQLYLISVENVFLEKIFFASKKELYSLSKIEADIETVPDKILDCIVWVGLKKKVL